ncbi:uncharacterized protein RSE6_14248 [Rhynchosporium secalis]|uniref:Uncharacterized protein n=1 Tax=Rhynchosporium secalis TaxID=38038 RepID=A0A1E1MUT2_RHYSE|nr:uncharacterized protein RSE6_14248 [Rhynchosporium secalis]
MNDSLQRIRMNTQLSANDIRAEIGKVLDIAFMLPFENEEPSDITRAAADHEEYVRSSAARSTELDFFDSSFYTTIVIQMLGDINQIHGYYEGPWQYPVTTVAPQVPFSFLFLSRELVQESIYSSGGVSGSGWMEGFDSQTGVVYCAKADLGIS